MLFLKEKIPLIVAHCSIRVDSHVEVRDSYLMSLFIFTILKEGIWYPDSVFPMLELDN